MVFLLLDLSQSPFTTEYVNGNNHLVDIVVDSVEELISQTNNLGLDNHDYYLQTCDGQCKFAPENKPSQRIEESFDGLHDGTILLVKRRLRGGMDFQHREGGKTGSGGQLSEAQAALERKERLRKLALETIDISKDPYFMRNHLGTFECKLCLTLHPNEGNYLAHTQGKRHQYNLGRRAAMEAKNAAPKTIVNKEAPVQRNIKIGRPGYKVTKSRDLGTRQRAITFELEYPEVSDTNTQPRHRFMSAFEQKVEAPDKNYQYLLIACAPYETVAFKVPNQPIDKREGRFFTNWDKEHKRFVLTLHFVDNAVDVSNTTTVATM